MTIDLIIKYKDSQKADGYFPVSTMGTFRKLWLPGCQALGLSFIPLFETGSPAIELNLDTLPHVIDELKRLKDYIIAQETTNHPQKTEYLEFLRGRFDRIITEMNKALITWDEIERIRV